MTANEPWFRHKEYGYGAGLPIHWKGWLLLGAYVAIILTFPYPLQAWLGYPPEFPERLATIAAVTISFLWIVRRKTDGGWRWRRGPEHDG